MSSQLAFPQAPRQRTVRISGPLPFPQIDPVSPLALRSKVHEAFCAQAHHSTVASLERFFLGLTAGSEDWIAEYPGLHDELGPYLGDAPADWSIAKVRTEFAVYSRMATKSESLPHLGRDEFVRFLLEMHRRLGEGANAFRSTPVRIESDRTGNQVVFPHHGRCLPLMHDLHAFISANFRAYPALCAMAAYAGIIHAHPFTDGNGRSARVAYNLIMAATGSRHFLPIHGLSSLRRGSFLVKLRRGMYGGDWAGLMAFLADASRLSSRLQAGPESTAAPAGDACWREAQRAATA